MSERAGRARRLLDGYTEFRVRIVANTDFVPFPSACVACGSPPDLSPFSKVQRFNVSRRTSTPATGESHTLVLSGEVHLCAACDQAAALPNEFIQFGLSQDERVIVQVSSPAAAEVFRNAVEPYAQRLKTIFEGKFGGYRLDMDMFLQEAQFSPDNAGWKPPLRGVGLIGSLIAARFSTTPSPARWKEAVTMR
jgi:hypothetical protein